LRRTPKRATPSTRLPGFAHQPPGGSGADVRSFRLFRPAPRKRKW
jgi:hypothetical protein